MEKDFNNVRLQVSEEKITLDILVGQEWHEIWFEKDKEPEAYNKLLKLYKYLPK